MMETGWLVGSLDGLMRMNRYRSDEWIFFRENRKDVTRLTIIVITWVSQVFSVVNEKCRQMNKSV